jgi:hypothetical protein
VALGDVGERVQLLAVQDALRNLDALHLRVLRLALPVGAAHQAEPAPVFRRNLAALELAERFHEFIDFRRNGKREPRAPGGLGIV